eukprot:3482872-Pyramimonas_sp.AAC.1
MTLGITSCLPKWDQEADLAAEIEPDNVWAASISDTRPITNLSPIYTAVTGDRFTQMAPWRELWLHDGAIGARKGYRYQAVSWELALDIEYAHITGTPTSG